MPQFTTRLGFSCCGLTVNCFSFLSCLRGSWDGTKNPETPYIEMEHLSEGDLTKRIGSPLPQETVRTISKQILDGLEVMHQKGIAHRDLKPAVWSLSLKFPLIILYRKNTNRCVEYFCSFDASPPSQAGGFRNIQTDPASRYHNISHPGVNSNLCCSRGSGVRF